MKDSPIQKVQSTPSCLAYSSEVGVELSAKASIGVMPISEGDRKVRRSSAATIGLAISMGAASLLLLNQNDAAVAADSFTAETTVASPSSSAIQSQSDEVGNPSSLTTVKPAPLAIEHRVEESKSLWQLSEEYRLAAKIIAANNKLSSQANFLAGQKLKISLRQEPEKSANKRKPAKKVASRSLELVDPRQLTSSLDKLKETQKRLQESLAQLKLIEVSQQLTILQSEGEQKTPSHLVMRPNASLPAITASLAPVTLETSKADSLPPHAKKLLADIERLQQDYADDSPSVSTSAQTETAEEERPTLVASETPNRGWRSDRKPGSNRTAVQRRETAQSQIPSPQPVSSNSQDREQIVGSAPADAEQYNQMIRVPVGETVGPDLPPLSVPDEYLPDTLPKFTGYIWPAKGVLTSGYGWRWGRMHKGVDIAAPIGTPIMAAASGEVISAGWNSGGFGNLVKLRHSDGSVTLYAHNSRILVRTGQLVEQGELIAEMGSTGYSTGPHLHFEIHPNGQSAANPMAYLPKQQS
ncbi:metalloendopeptidase-like membrane protein [Pleurocapsa sp. PCC 7327]|nr:M23 family metallopeptidase [Pleurocapsa sp. PCC 7327]AFY76246.1 metalloendopeptidase-like membrane protein [Pleurocapsa sp. PCC 7327]